MDESKLRVLIKDLLGMPSGSVRPRGNQPIEGDNIAIVYVSDVENRGWSGGNADAKQMSIATITIDFLGSKAKHYARQLKPAMQSSYAIEQMLKLDMGFVDCDAGRDLTALELDQIDRYQVKMQLSYSTKYEKPSTLPDVYYIEQIPIGPTDDYPNALGLIAEP